MGIKRRTHNTWNETSLLPHYQQGCEPYPPKDKVASVSRKIARAAAFTLAILFGSFYSKLLLAHQEFTVTSTAWQTAWQTAFRNYAVAKTTGEINDIIRKHDGFIIKEASIRDYPRKNNKNNKAKKELRFDDIEILDILGWGAFSVANRVKLPTWVYEQYNLPGETQLVLKMTANPNMTGREITAFQKIAQHPGAREAGHVPLLFAQINMTNPWDCEGDGTGRKIPEMYYEEQQGRIASPVELLCRSSHMDIMVMPKVRRTKIFDYDRPIATVTKFMQSLLQQMDIAHKMGVNNNDLAADKNIHFNPVTGQAVLADWNGGMRMPGDPVSWPDWPLDNNPPEFWAMTLFAPTTKTVVLHGVDMWQIGMVWARLIFSPCGWRRWNWDHGRTMEFVRENLQAIGDKETIIPLNATFETDIMPHVYQTANPPPIASTTFTPLLSISDISETSQEDCPAKSSWFMDNDAVPAVKKEQALDMLRSMLRIDPRRRSTCQEILKHPFFYKAGSTTELEDWQGVNAILPGHHSL